MYRKQINSLTVVSNNMQYEIFYEWLIFIEVVTKTTYAIDTYINKIEHSKNVLIVHKSHLKR